MWKTIPRFCRCGFQWGGRQVPRKSEDCPTRIEQRTSTEMVNLSAGTHLATDNLIPRNDTTGTTKVPTIAQLTKPGDYAQIARMTRTEAPYRLSRRVPLPARGFRRCGKKKNPNRAGPGFGNCITCPVTKQLSPVTHLTSTLPKGTPCPESPDQSPYQTGRLWTRRDSNPHLVTGQVNVLPLHHGPCAQSRRF
jgi:hypothetical protein